MNVFQHWKWPAHGTGTVSTVSALSFAITQYTESQYEPLGVVGAEGEQLTAAGLRQLDGPDSAAVHRPTLPPAAPPAPTHSVLVHRPPRAFSRQCTSAQVIGNCSASSPRPRAVLTNGHTGHVPRAPGFFFFLRGPQLAVVK